MAFTPRGRGGRDRGGFGGRGGTPRGGRGGGRGQYIFATVAHGSFAMSVPGLADAMTMHIVLHSFSQ